MNLFHLYLHRNPLLAVAAVALGIVNGLVTAWLIALISGQLDRPADIGVAAIGLFVGVCLLRLATGVGAHLIMIRLAQRAICDLRAQISRGILNSDLRHLEALGSNRLLAYFAEDIPRVAAVVVNIPYFIVNILTLAACLTYIGMLSAVMLVAVTAGIGVGLISYLWPVTAANARLRLARQTEDEFFEHVRDLIDGICELKQSAERQDEFCNTRLSPTIESVYRRNVAGISLYATAANWIRLLFFVLVGGLILLHQRELAADPGKLAAIILTLLYMMAPVEAICNSLPHYVRANIALKKLAECRGQLAQRAESIAATTAPALPGYRQLVLRDVAFQYGDETSDDAFRLGPINLTFERGQIVLVTGSNGGGKTTLARIIAGLYLPRAGSIELDSTPVEPGQYAAYRSQVAAVWSDCHVLPTIPRSGDRTVQRLAEEMLDAWQLSRRVQLTAGRFSEVRALSSGQRKRLALINAALVDADIYIFDEWAANQDPEFTAHFYRRYLPDLARRHKIVLVISHDEHYFDIADRLLAVHDGRHREIAPPALATSPTA